MPEKLHMWTYWRDKKGLDEAATVYYADLFKSNPELAKAYQEYQAAERQINRLMRELNREEEDENDDY